MIIMMMHHKQCPLGSTLPSGPFPQYAYTLTPPAIPIGSLFKEIFQQPDRSTCGQAALQPLVSQSV